MGIFGGGHSKDDGDGAEGGSFIDCDSETGTGEEIQGAYWKCSDCQGITRVNDSHCPSCGAYLEGWEQKQEIDVG